MAHNGQGLLQGWNSLLVRAERLLNSAIYSNKSLLSDKKQQFFLCNPL